MFCSRCGVEIKERIRSCYFCGNEIHLPKGEKQQVTSQVQEAEPEKKRKNKLAVPYAIVCLLISIIVAVIVIELPEGGGSSRVDFEEYILVQLEAMDRTSRTEIDDWVRAYENNSDITVITEFVDTDGNNLEAEWWGRRAGFVEWNMDFGERRRTVRITYLFDLEKANDPYRFWFGEAFMHSGFRITIHDRIHWRGENYFKLDVTMENISSETEFFIPGFSLFCPDGELLSGVPTITLADIRFTPVEKDETVEGFLYFRYVGPGDYSIGIWSLEDTSISFIEAYITVGR